MQDWPRGSKRRCCRERVEAFCRYEAMMGDESSQAQLLDEGLLCRITGLAEALARGMVISSRQ